LTWSVCDIYRRAANACHTRSHHGIHVGRSNRFIPFGGQQDCAHCMACWISFVSRLDKGRRELTEASVQMSKLARIYFLLLGCFNNSIRPDRYIENRRNRRRLYWRRFCECESDGYQRRHECHFADYHFFLRQLLLRKHGTGELHNLFLGGRRMRRGHWPAGHAGNLDWCLLRSFGAGSYIETALGALAKCRRIW
jgi:hypothetical protein